MPESIRTKLTIITLLTIVFCSVSVMLISVEEHETLYKQSETGHLDALTSNLAEELVGILNEEDAIFELSTTLLQFDKYSSVRFVLIYDANWQPIHEYVHPNHFKDTNESYLESFDIKAIPQGISFGRSELIAKRVIGEQDYPIGYLLMVSDYHGPLEVTLNKLYSQIIPLVLVICFIALAFDNLFIKRLLAPLDNLAKFTQKVTNTGDYQLKAELTGSIEIKNLSSHINHMLGTIYDRTLENQKYTKALEKQQASLEKLANYDTLTSLPNRKMFRLLLEKELAHAKRNESHIAVMFLDLDNFKHINDSLGHAIGDLLLITVAKFIQLTLREGDTMARFGGDEFLILVRDADNIESIIVVANRIIERLKQPFKVKDWEVDSGVSIGISTTLSSDYDAENLIRHADLAMYHAKDKGKSTYSFFDDDLLKESVRKLEIANAITQALANNEFTVFYQPKVSPENIVVGLEALLRWHSSYDGFISPAEFIPIAEQSGRIDDLTRWLINQVFTDYEEISKLSDHGIHISLNLSAFDLRDTSLIDYIRSELLANRVDPKQIEFEITESAYLEDFENATKFLKELGKSGCTVALDDFGTGYSSLSYLSKIEVDTLKIDHSFVKNLENSRKDRFIIQSIVNLGKSFQLSICAEGVETSTERDALVAMGCHQLQGYLFSKPVPLNFLGENIRKIEALQNIDEIKSARPNL